MSQMQEFERVVRAAIAAKNNPTIEEVAKTVAMFASIYPDVSKEQVERIKREIEQSIPTTMAFGIVLSNPFKPWIENARAGIDWFYWERYKNYLIEQKGFGTKLISSLSEVTEKILGLVENPKKNGRLGTTWYGSWTSSIRKNIKLFRLNNKGCRCWI